MERIGSLAGWVERDEHLERYHGIARVTIDTLDSDDARKLHAWLHREDRASARRRAARTHVHVGEV